MSKQIDFLKRCIALNLQSGGLLDLLDRIEELERKVASRDAEVVSLTNQRDYEYVRAENAEQERDQLRNELEIERMRNVACGVVAMADTPDSAKQARDMHPDYMSAACSDVARRVDECIKLREQVKMLQDVVGHVAGMRFSIVTTKMCEAALAATEPKE